MNTVLENDPWWQSVMLYVLIGDIGPYTWTLTPLTWLALVCSVCPCVLWHMLCVMWTWTLTIYKQCIILPVIHLLSPKWWQRHMWHLMHSWQNKRRSISSKCIYTFACLTFVVIVSDMLEITNPKTTSGTLQKPRIPVFFIVRKPGLKGLRTSHITQLKYKNRQGMSL